MLYSIERVTLLFFALFFSSCLSAADSTGRWRHDNFHLMEQGYGKVDSTRNRERYRDTQITKLLNASNIVDFYEIFEEMDFVKFENENNLIQLVNIMSIGGDLRDKSLFKYAINDQLNDRISHLYDLYFSSGVDRSHAASLLYNAEKLGIKFTYQAGNAIRVFLREILETKSANKIKAREIIDLVYLLYILDVSLHDDVEKLLKSFIGNISAGDLDYKNTGKLLRICAHFRVGDALKFQIFQSERIKQMSFNDSVVFNMLNSLSIILLNENYNHNHDSKKIIFKFMKYLTTLIKENPRTLIEDQNYCFFYYTLKAFSYEPGFNYIPNRLTHAPSPSEEGGPTTSNPWQEKIDILKQSYPQLEVEKKIAVTCSPVDVYLEIENKKISQKLALQQQLLLEQDLEEGEIISERKEEIRQKKIKNIKKDINKLEEEKNYKIIIQFDGPSHFLFRGNYLLKENGSTSAQTKLFESYGYVVYRLGFDDPDKDFCELQKRLKKLSENK